MKEVGVGKRMLKKTIFWFLLFYFVFIIPIGSIIEAQRIEFLRWQDKVAARTNYLRQLEEQSRVNVEKLAQSAIRPVADLAKINTAKAIVSENGESFGDQVDKDKAKAEADCQADPICRDLPVFGLFSPASATLGDTIPVTVVAEKAQNVSKVDLSIDDPSSGTTHFKASFINIKKRADFLFTYNWDTFLAKTKADTGKSSHKITAEFYSEENSKFILVGKINSNTKVNPFKGYDPMGDAFWSGYLKGDGSFNQAWKEKLGCAGASDSCKDQEAVKSAFAQGVSDGRITEDDVTDINSTFSLYTTQLNGEKFSEDEKNANRMADWFNMSDLAQTANESMDQKLGVPSDSESADFLKSPEKLTVAKILEEYSAKIASYDPQSVDELKALPFWGEIEKKIENQISQDPADLPFKETDGAPVSGENTSSFNFFRIREAKASLLTLGLSVGFLAYDVYNFVKKPSWANAGMIALSAAVTAGDVFMVPGGEAMAAARLGSKGVQIGAKILTKLPALGRLVNKSKTIFGAIKGSEAVTKAFSKIKGLKEAYAGGKVALETFVKSNKYLSALLTRVGPLGSKVAGWFSGRVNKVLGAGGKLAKWAAKFAIDHPLLAASMGIHVAKAVDDSMEGVCDKSFIEKVAGVFSPLKNAIQYMQCIILTGIQGGVDLIMKYMTEVLDYSKIDQQPIRSLAIWKVDQAHASLSSNLNPKLTPHGPLEYITKVWDTLRVFINFFLAFMIIFISFANIFHIDINKYAVKKTLPGLILGVILANFSALICRGILDVAQVLISFVTGGNNLNLIYGQAVDALALTAIAGLVLGTAVIGVVTIFTGGLGIAPFIILGLLLFVGAFVPLLIMLVSLVFRTGIIIVLFGISPLAFLCLGSPLTSKWFTKWWEEYVKWAFLPVVMFFLVWLAAQVAGTK